MHRIKRLFLSMSVFFFLSGTADPKSLEITRRTADYEVGIRLDRNPPILGDNPMDIAIRDRKGNPVVDAKVLVNYYMPPMPRMAPMNFATDAKVKKETYRTTLSLIMSGPWIVVVKVMREGKTVAAKFNFDAQ
jgi:hypothetical protein